MKANNIFSAVNGLFTLANLKPSFIQFAKSEISDLKRIRKEEGDVVWGNSQPKVIGRIVVGNANKSKRNFPKNFIRNPL